MTDMELMGEALKEAEAAAAEGEMPVGCVIAKDGEIIARGYNLREQTQDPTAHAEIVAMRRAAQVLGSWRLENTVMAVTLEPCPMCAGAISQARVGRLIYGASDPDYGCAGSVYRIPEDPAFNHFCKSDGGLLAEQCLMPLKAFFKKRR